MDSPVFNYIIYSSSLRSHIGSRSLFMKSTTGAAHYALFLKSTTGAAHYDDGYAGQFRRLADSCDAKFKTLTHCLRQVEDARAELVDAPPLPPEVSAPIVAPFHSTSPMPFGKLSDETPVSVIIALDTAKDAIDNKCRIAAEQYHNVRLLERNALEMKNSALLAKLQALEAEADHARAIYDYESLKMQSFE